MDQLITDFHFARPLWLLGCIPALLLFVSLWHIRSRSSGWNRAIDPALLPHLLDATLGKRQNWPLGVILLAWLLSCVSLAGPVWEKLPQPIQKKENALIIIQDLSLSFYAQDLSPNRLVRAQHKLADILKQRNEGTTALVVYSGGAHIVSPLTDDSKTISAMVDSLSPGIMPNYGSTPAEAVKVAVQLLRDAGLSQGKILLLTDEVEQNDVQEISKQLKGKDVVLNVLGIGTSDGGPIPTSDGGFLKDDEGSIIVPRLNRSVLRELATDNNGRYSDIQLDDRDIDFLLAENAFAPNKDEYRQLDREFDQWKEMGPWLLLLILPVVLFAFRRGWLLVVLVSITISLGTTQSYAFTWQDLWQRKDQQAAEALNKNDPEKAAELFKSPSWKGVAEYKANNFDSAIESFGQNETADNYYNSGNALAKAGKFDEALKKYDKALKIDPDMEDAAENRKLVEQLMQQQQQQNENQSQDSDNQDQQGQNQEKSEQGDQNQQDQGEQENQQQSSDTKQDQQSQQENKQSGNDSPQQKEQQDADATQSQQEKDQQQEDSADEQKQSVAQKESKNEEQQQPNEAMQAVDNDMTGEEKQALEQWLRQVPDNPGGLLRRKFEYESRQNQSQNNPRKGSKIW